MQAPRHSNHCAYRETSTNPSIHMRNVDFSTDLVVVAEQKETDKEYWISALGEKPGAHFKPDFQAGPGPETTGTLAFTFTEQSSRRALEICRYSDYKLHALLTSVLTALLYKYNQESQFVISSPIYRQAQHQHFINTLLPIAVEVLPTDTFKDILLRVDKAISQAVAHQNYPVLYAIERFPALSPRNGLPVHNVVALLENIHDPEYLAGLSTNVSLHFRRDDHAVRGRVCYNELSYREATVGKVIRDYEKLLDAVLNDLNLPVAQMPGESSRFACYLVGGSSMVTKCAEILLEKGHQVLGILTSDPQVLSAGAESNVPVIGCSGQAEMLALLAGREMDYLFSINNPIPLSSGVLAIPRKYPINFHDSLLPRYAGMHATAWAIANGEKVHGITWHVIEEKIDAGSILAQTVIPLSEDETVFSLNLKCYNSAINAFRELVGKIENDQLTPRAQDLSERTYYGLHKKPFAAGIMDFEKPAEVVSAAIRSLSYGSTYDNPLACPKLVIGSKVLIPKSVRVLDTAGAEPGTVLQVGARSVTVATGTTDVELLDLTELGGAPAALLPGRYPGIGPGTRLSVPGEALRDVEGLNLRVCRHEAFWRRQLHHDTPADLSGVLGKAAGGAATTGGRVPLHLPGGYGAGAQPDRLVLLFTAFLYRLSGTPDFAVQYSDEQLAGLTRQYEHLFARYVPFRIAADPSWAVTDFLETAGRHLGEMRRALTFPRDLFNRYPDLRESRFNTDPGQFAEVVITSRGWEALAEDLPATLRLVVSAQTGEAGIIYNERTYSAPEVEQLAHRFACFVRNATQHLHHRVVSIPIVDAEEEKQILLGFNDTQREYARNKTLQQLVEESAAVHGDKTAVVCQGQSLTYAELNRRANRLAHQLRKDGVGRESLVGIIATRSPEMFIGILAILKAGGVYVPIDAETPPNRMRRILVDTQPAYLVTFGLADEFTQRLWAGLPPGRVYSLDDRAGAGEPASTGSGNEEADWAGHNPAPVTTADDVAYIMHTSGSTGTPKGVVVKHRPVINTLEWVNREYGVNSDDELLFITSVGFDLSVYDIFGILGVGGTIRIVPKEDILQPKRLVELMHRHRVTIWDSTPGVLQQLVPFLAEGEAPGPLRLVLLSGDWIPLSLPPKVKAAFPGATVVSLGGATEATIWSNFFVIGDIAPGWVSIPYGKPIQNARYFIFDKYMNVCPVGMEGDLYIGGECLSEGYINKVEITSERFLANPHLPGGTIYRTGDRAKWFSDGNMEFLGREDRQLKIRGFRVELGEVENIMAGFDGLQEVVVLPKVYEEGEKRLMAYYTAPREIDKQALRKFLQEHLPDYMVPARFIQVSAIPHTSVGKVDGKALALLGDEEQEAVPAAQMPATDLEVRIAAIWEKTLGQQHIKLTDNFFQLGGHSFLVIKASLLLQSEFGKEPRFIDFVNASLGDFVRNYAKDLPVEN